MSRFTVTIESDQSDGGTMTIHLDTSAGTPRVLEVTMAAAAGGSVSAVSFTQLALDRLVSAFAPETSAPSVAAVAAVPAVTVQTPQPAPAPQPAAPAPVAASPEPTAAPAAAPAPEAPAKAAGTPAKAAEAPVKAAGAPAKATEATAKATGAPAKAARAAKATAKAARASAKAAKAPAKATGKTRPAKAVAAEAADGTERQYRRMPDATELVDAYQQAPSVTDLAARYEVPRYTMNGWLARLRREGLIAPRRGADAQS